MNATVWVHPWRRKGVSFKSWPVPAWSTILWGTEPPVLHCIVQMQEVHCSLPWEITLVQGLSHNVTDKEAEACGDEVFLSADQ